MASEEAAVTMVNYYTSAPPTIRNQPIFIQYSTHRELKTDNLTNQVSSSSSLCLFSWLQFAASPLDVTECFTPDL